MRESFLVRFAAFDVGGCNSVVFGVRRDDHRFEVAPFVRTDLLANVVNPCSPLVVREDCRRMTLQLRQTLCGRVNLRHYWSRGVLCRTEPQETRCTSFHLILLLPFRRDNAAPVQRRIVSYWSALTGCDFNLSEVHQIVDVIELTCVERLLVNATLLSIC